MIILDTSALLYWTSDPDKLSSKAEQAIEQADRILISSIPVLIIIRKRSGDSKHGLFHTYEQKRRG